MAYLKKDSNQLKQPEELTGAPVPKLGHTC